VKAYFDRWPQQELVFRAMKGFVSLHLVAGYGKQEVEDTTVRKKQQWLEEKIGNLRACSSWIVALQITVNYIFPILYAHIRTIEGSRFIPEWIGKGSAYFQMAIEGAEPGPKQPKIA